MGQNARCRSAASAASALSAAFGCRRSAACARQTYRRSPKLAAVPVRQLGLAAVEALEVIRRPRMWSWKSPGMGSLVMRNQWLADREASVGDRPVDTGRWATSPILVWCHGRLGGACRRRSSHLPEVRVPSSSRRRARWSLDNPAIRSVRGHLACVVGPPRHWQGGSELDHIAGSEPTAWHSSSCHTCGGRRGARRESALGGHHPGARQAQDHTYAVRAELPRQDRASTPPLSRRCWRQRCC